MLETREQWDKWMLAIVADLATCGIKKSIGDVEGKLSNIIGFDLEGAELQIDLYEALLGENTDKDLESQFHDYVNTGSFRDESNPFSSMQKYYPPCKNIFSLLPVGIVLSDQESEWFWTNLLLNSFGLTNPDLINPDLIDLHKDLKLVTAGDGKMMINGADKVVVESINDAYLTLSKGRFTPLIQADH